jgi:hypothetical protein
MHSADLLLVETLLIGPGNALANIVVYVSAGEAESFAGEINTVTFDHKGCYCTIHVLAVQTGQEIKISNSDPVAHNVERYGPEAPASEKNCKELTGQHTSS